MTITPRLFLINDPLTALGKLVRPAEVEKVDPIVAFNKGNHGGLAETECRQPKRTPQEQAELTQFLAQQAEIAKSLGVPAYLLVESSPVDAFVARRQPKPPFKAGDKVTYRPEVDWPGQIRTVRSVEWEWQRWVVYYAEENYSHDGADKLELIPPPQESDAEGCRA